MKKIRCYDCGKSYNYHEDAFCPSCGAFNQPPRASRIAADGSVVRNDGLNEANHQGSFVHQELHDEKRERRKHGLDKRARPMARPAARQSAAVRSADGRGQAGKKSLAGLIVWIIFALVFFNVFSRVIWYLF